MNTTDVKTPKDLGITIKKITIFFGLFFAQISNFVFWVEDAIPIEGFFIFDMFLIFSLFLIIFKEKGMIKHDSTLVNYTCFLGAMNNFIITLFFLLWGIFFPEKDMAFVHKLGIDGNFQIAFDLISLWTLRLIYIKYKNRIEGLTTEKIFLYEILLMIGLASTLLIL